MALRVEARSRRRRRIPVRAVRRRRRLRRRRKRADALFSVMQGTQPDLSGPVRSCLGTDVVVWNVLRGSVPPRKGGAFANMWSELLRTCPCATRDRYSRFPGALPMIVCRRDVASLHAARRTILQGRAILRLRRGTGVAPGSELDDMRHACERIVAAAAATSAVGIASDADDASR